MAVIPETPSVSVQVETQIPNRTYKLDLDKGRIVGFVDGEEALQQAAEKAIRTPRFNCYAYDDQYGSELTSLLSTPNVSREYIEAEIEFILQDTLCQDGRISSIEDLSISFDSDEAYFTFIVNTILGQIRMEGTTDYV